MASYRTLRATQHRDRSNFRMGKRAGDPRDWKVLCVCEKECNNGWMRQLDDRARPIIVPILKGQHTRISTSDQTVIAAWATMKAMVAEYDDPDHVTTHHTHRKRMRAKQLPPNNGWVIWIGHFPRKIWTPTWTSYPFLVLPRKVIEARGSDRATHYNGQASTQVVGEIFIHIIRAPMPLFLRNWTFEPLPDGGILNRIWPATNYSIAWPPRPMSDRDAYTATRMFRRIMERSAFRPPPI